MTPTPQITVLSIDRSNRKDPIFQLRAGESTISRRHADISRLHQQLLATCPARVIPPVPTCKHVGGFGAVPVAVLDDHLREEMQQFFDSCLVIPEAEVEMVAFLASAQPPAQKPSSSTSAGQSSGSGGSAVTFLKSMAKSVAANLSSPRSSIKDVDPWYDAHRMDVQTHMAMSERCSAKIDKCLRAQRGIGLALAELGARLNDLANVVATAAEADGYRQLAKSAEKVGGYYQTIGDTQSMRLGDHVAHQSRLCDSAQRAMDARLNALSDYEQSCKSTMKRRIIVERMRAGGAAAAATGAQSPPTFEQAQHDYSASKRHEDQCKKQFDQMSTTIKNEWPRLVDSVSGELARAVDQYHTTALLLGKKECEEWSVCGPQVRHVVEAGGSRPNERPTPEVL